MFLVKLFPIFNINLAAVVLHGHVLSTIQHMRQRLQRQNVKDSMSQCQNFKYVQINKSGQCVTVNKDRMQ